MVQDRNPIRLSRQRALQAAGAAGAAVALGLLVIAVAALTSGRDAAAQTVDPYADLHADVARIGGVIDSGNVAAIINELAPVPEPGPIIRTAYPGDGERVSRGQAAAEIPSLIVSTATASDELGPGRFAVLGVWIPSVEPGIVIIMASGIEADGDRLTVAFGLEEVDGTWAITSYGHVLGPAEFLDSWDAQGDLRRVTPDPLPPATGSGLAAKGGSGESGLLFVIAGFVCALVAGLSGLLVRRRH